ncbi:MAG TPA: hypothetical protein VF376_05170 [Thermoanaerobaculia bacterium]
MLKLASVFFAVGIGAETIFFLSPSEQLSPAPLVGLTAFSLFLIFLILGLPWTRKLLE